MQSNIAIESVPELIDQEKHIPTQKKRNAISAISFNVEGLTSYKIYLETLSKHADIIMIQEHWLHNYEKHKLEEHMNGFACFSKCFDDGLLSDPTERHRGHAGVAICVSRKFEQLVELLPDGGNRVIGIKFKCKTPVIFLCIYMPCRGNGHTADDDQQILDEISEILTKYGGTAKFVIGGYECIIPKGFHSR